MTNNNNDIRVGIGYDVHKLTENRKLILGGVEIKYEKGLDGHSDTDRVSVKATTTERLGFEGRCEGISAQAVCSIKKAQ